MERGDERWRLLFAKKRADVELSSTRPTRQSEASDYRTGLIVNDRDSRGIAVLRA